MAIRAYFKPGETDVTVNGLYQWDEGQTLIIHDDTLPDAAVVYFACSNDKEALEGQFCEKNASCMSVLIPDELLQRPAAIRAWVCESADEYCKTLRTIVLPIIPRAKPSEVIPSGATEEDKVVELDMTYGDQVVNASAGKHMESVTVLKPDTLIPSNIKKNVEIAGIVGTMEPTAVEANLKHKLYNVAENGSYTITPDEGFDGMTEVFLNVKVPAILVDAALQEKTIVQNGEYTPAAGYDGFKKIIVDVPVTGEEYKSQDKTVSPSTSEQVVTPDTDFDGLSSVTVGAVTSSIDENIAAENIKAGISILGVAGSYSPEGFTTQSKTVSPSTSEQKVTPDGDYDGLDSVTVEAVTSSIDENIKPENIKAGVEVLGVTGACTPEAFAIISQPQNFKGEMDETATFTIGATGVTSYQWQQDTGSGWSDITTSAGRSESISISVAEFRLTYKYRCVVSNGIETLTSDEVNLVLINNFTTQDKTVNPTTSEQTIAADEGFDGLGSVTVEAVTSTIDSNITAENIKAGISILGVTGSYTPEEYVTQSKTVSPSTEAQTVTPDADYDGLDSVTVEAITAENIPNLTAENIKAGAEVLGITGTAATYISVASADDLANYTSMPEGTLAIVTA